MVSILSLNTLPKSALVAYSCDVSVEIGCLRGIVSFVLLDCAIRRAALGQSWCQSQALSA